MPLFTGRFHVKSPTRGVLKSLCLGLALIAFFVLSGSAAFSQPAPRLFELDWGVNPARAEAILARSQKDFSGLRFVPETPAAGTNETALDEIVSLSRHALLRYETRFPAFYNRPAVIVLTFYNPTGARDALALGKVEVAFTVEEKYRNWESLRLVFHDLTTLFREKYRIPDIEAEPAPSDTALTRQYGTNAVTVIFTVTAKDLEQRISYEMNDMNGKARDRQLALDKEAAGTMTVVVPDRRTTTTVLPDQTTKTKQPLGLSVQAEAGWTPFIYNAFENSHGNAVAVFVSAGLPLPPVRLGGMLSYQYASFDGFDPATAFHGAWGILELAGFVEYQPLDWLTLRGGLGAGWRASSFEDQNLGVERLDEFGLLIHASASAAPLDWLTVKVPVRLNLFFTAAGVAPLFSAAARAEFKVFGWLNPFVELGLETWSYEGTLFTTTQGLFILTAGARFSIDL